MFLPYKANDNKRIFHLFCKDLLDKRSIAYIDISKSAEVENIDLILRDDIHTNNFGSKIYAQLITEKFLELQSSLNVNRLCRKTKYTDLLKLRIEKTFTDKIVLIGRCEIIGLLLTIGPHSGKIFITNTNGDKTVNTWDKSCYYPRQHFNLATTVQGETVLHILPDSFDTSSCKNKMQFDRIKKKLIVHDIYYIGESISLKNNKDGKRINKFGICINKMHGRILQKIKKTNMYLIHIIKGFIDRVHHDPS